MSGLPDDATVQLLAQGADADPSDTNRLVLADRLQELGDPRGELIALQIERARTGTPATPRELELLEHHGRSWLGPLAPSIAAFTFRRGFLATVRLDDFAGVPDELLDHPLWGTVEELEGRSAALIASPALHALRRIAVAGDVFAALTRQPHATTIEAVLGPTGYAGGPRTRRLRLGIVPVHDELDADTRAFPRLRAMSLSIETPDDLAQTLRFLAGPLGERLDHVELFAPSLPFVAGSPWRTVDEHRRRPTLALRSLAGDWTVVLARRAEQLVVQLGDAEAPTSPDLHNLMPVLQSLGHGFTAVRLETVGRAPEVDLSAAEDELRRQFQTVDRASGAAWLSP